MSRTLHVGYDNIKVYSIEELIAMYMAEGKSEAESYRLAKKLYCGMNSLTSQERKFWNKCKVREHPAGLCPLEELEE